MTFLINTDNKTITIKGSYRFEEFQEAMKGILKDYSDYKIEHNQTQIVVKGTDLFAVVKRERAIIPSVTKILTHDQEDFPINAEDITNGYHTSNEEP